MHQLKISEKKQVQLETLIGLAALINSALDHTEVRKRAIDTTTMVLNVEAASLLLLDEVTGELYFDVATGDKGDKIMEIRLQKGVGIAGLVAESGNYMIIHDAQSDPHFFKNADKISGFLTRNIICVPIKTKDRIIGVLEAVNKKEGQFDDSDLQLMQTLSNFIAVSIENISLYNELKETFYSTTEVLAEIIELRDPYTGGHTKRVTGYSMIIGNNMGLSTGELEKLQLAAILHDIGKIGVSDKILRKHEKLEGDDLYQMAMHPQFGSELLKIKQLKDIIPGIRGHHERFDGTGYPDKLKGSEIPLIARIIAVADTFDAMTTDRPYRKGLSKRKALAELKRYAGTQFDPKVVELFLNAASKDEHIAEIRRIRSTDVPISGIA